MNLAGGSWPLVLAESAGVVVVGCITKDTHHGVLAPAVELVVITGLEAVPLCFLVRPDFVSEIGDDVVLRELDDEGLVVHHGPVAVGLVEVHAVGGAVAGVVVEQSDLNEVGVARDLELVVGLDDLESTDKRKRVNIGRDKFYFGGT